MQGLRQVGAMIALLGLAENGGLFGDAVENIRPGMDDTLLDDAYFATTVDESVDAALRQHTALLPQPR